MTLETFGNITLINGDCMEYLCSLPDKSFQLTVCDPPWGIDIGNGLGSAKKTCKMHQSWQFDAPDKAYFDELMRVSENQIIWGGGNTSQTYCPLATTGLFGISSILI